MSTIRLTLETRLRRLVFANPVGRVRFLSVSLDRILMEFDGEAYLILTPQSKAELTPQRIADRIEKWPRLKKRDIIGYILLCEHADLSLEVMRANGRNLPKMVAVVGLWGRVNRLVASNIDDQMEQLLKAVVPRPGARRAMPRQTAKQVRRTMPGQAPKRPKRRTQPTASPEAPRTETQSHGWVRSLRKGMRLDVYELDRRLGRGHSAEVWKAHVVKPINGVDLVPGTTVAIKVYSPSLMQGTQPLRIQREFTVASDLMHNNLARVYDLVLSPSRPFHTFMVMEYVDGPSLKALIEQKGKLNSEEVLAIGAQLFSALAELHSVSAVHRDVKAANIMLTDYDQAEPKIKLVDLGIVSLVTDDRFTAASVFMGSKHSAPLEQLTGGDPDERTDIYGAGTVLYHCVTGRAMYQDIGPEGAIVRKMLSTPEFLSLGSLPISFRGLTEFINRCIAVEAKDRPRSALECASEIDELRNLFRPGRG